MEERIKILIVDDDPDVLRATAKAVEAGGYDVILAATGGECLESVTRDRPDLVLLDVVLPDMEGTEVCARMKGDPAFPRTFVILLSGLKTSSEHQAQGLSVGADGYIARPISNKELLARIQAMVRIKQAEDELKTAQARVLQQEKMASVGQLAAGVAHEINNPMGFIISNLGSLKNYTQRFKEFIEAQSRAILSLNSSETISELEEKRKKLKIDYMMDDVDNLITESSEGAQRVKKIVQDLMSFSRVDDTEQKTSDINAGIESTINIVWNELKYKATVTRDYGELPLITCNIGRLNQVFMNILVNAAHAIEKQGEITVKTWHDNEAIHVRITDTGQGMQEEVVKRIFEPFFTTKAVGKGTGLGLSIAYDIVKKQHGEILVESKVGAGSAFTVIIPVS